MKVMRLEQVDGSVWAIPVIGIAINCAEHFADEYDDDPERILRNYTIPLFAADEQKIIEWAMVNLDWDEAFDFAILMEYGRDDGYFQWGWINGKKEIVEVYQDQVITKNAFEIMMRVEQRVMGGGKIFE